MDNDLPRAELCIEPVEGRLWGKKGGSCRQGRAGRCGLG
jgi:hypothetical protein